MSFSGDSFDKKIIEIEKKYIVNDKRVFNEIISLLGNHSEYILKYTDVPRLHQDIYFDTDDYFFLRSDKILRIRNLGSCFLLTIKLPLSEKAKNICSFDYSNYKFARHEYEFEISSDNLDKNKDIFLKYLPELYDHQKGKQLQLSKVLTIKNNRKKVYIQQKSTMYELAFDEVEYINKYNYSEKEYQIEIELMSDYKHCLPLKELTRFLEENINSLTPIMESKYKRGITILNDV